MEFNKKKVYWIGAVIILTVLGYAALILIKTWPIDVWSVDKAGVFGDSFGVITCLFTALAFLGVVISLETQRSYSRQQQINTEKQDFENNFFQMLSHLNELTKDIDFALKENRLVTIFYGRSAIDELTNIFKNYYRLEEFSSNSLVARDEKEIIESCYNDFWREFGDKLGHYFRWLYNTYSYVNSKDNIDRFFYAKLISAQLSNQELFLIYYNSMFSRGKKFESLIKEYNIMSNLEKRELISPSHSEIIEGVIFWDDLEKLRTQKG